MNIDDFPSHLVQASSPPPAPAKRRGFALGTAEDAKKQGYDVVDDEDDDVEEIPAPAPVQAKAEPFRTAARAAVEELGSRAVDSYQEVDPKTAGVAGKLAAKAASMLPELTNVTAIDFARRREEPPKPCLANLRGGRRSRGERVTRGWLDTLSQRQMFVAIGFNVTKVMRTLDGHATVKDVISWMDDGIEMPWEYRTILTLQHLLDRRSQYTRLKLPERIELEKKLNRLPIDVKISQLLGEASRDVVKISRYGAAQLSLRQEQIAAQLKVVAPKGDTSPRSRNVAGVGIGRRSRPLGEPISKPNSYCYKVSKASTSSDGRVGLEPNEVMQLINRAADMERRYGVAYTLTRREKHLPWGPDNVALVPSEGA